MKKMIEKRNQKNQIMMMRPVMQKKHKKNRLKSQTKILMNNQHRLDKKRDSKPATLTPTRKMELECQLFPAMVTAAMATRTAWDLTCPRPSAGQPRGYAFVTFVACTDANKARTILDGKLLGCKHVMVRWANTVSKLANALVVLSSTAEDGEIEVRISEELERHKPELKIPALAGAQNDKKLSRQTTIQAIEAKLKLMEHGCDDEFKVNNRPAGILYRPPPVIRDSSSTNSRLHRGRQQARPYRRSQRFKHHFKLLVYPLDLDIPMTQYSICCVLHFISPSLTPTPLAPLPKRKPTIPKHGLVARLAAHGLVASDCVARPLTGFGLTSVCVGRSRAVGSMLGLLRASRVDCNVITCENGDETLIRRRGGFSEAQTVDRIYSNLRPSIRINIRRCEVETVAQLLQVAVHFQQCNGEIRDYYRWAQPTRKETRIVEDQMNERLGVSGKTFDSGNGHGIYGNCQNRSSCTPTNPDQFKEKKCYRCNSKFHLAHNCDKQSQSNVLVVSAEAGPRREGRKHNLRSGIEFPRQIITNCPPHHSKETMLLGAPVELEPLKIVALLDTGSLHNVSEDLLGTLYTRGLVKDSERSEIDCVTASLVKFRVVTRLKVSVKIAGLAWPLWFLVAPRLVTQMTLVHNFFRGTRTKIDVYSGTISFKFHPGLLVRLTPLSCLDTPSASVLEERRDHRPEFETVLAEYPDVSRFLGNYYFTLDTSSSPAQSLSLRGGLCAEFLVPYLWDRGLPVPPLALRGWLRTASSSCVVCPSLWFRTHIHARRPFTSRGLSMLGLLRVSWGDCNVITRENRD
uniref:(California timema) hypothetical protein n=1 Tax=Timema californicum TaxID=61474 RepID=A0A7R9J967_TIMCA|nr:unnamed protein product [Timema californicum]